MKSLIDYNQKDLEKIVKRRHILILTCIFLFTISACLGLNSYFSNKKYENIKYISEVKDELYKSKCKIQAYQYIENLRILKNKVDSVKWFKEMKVGFDK